MCCGVAYTYLCTYKRGGACYARVQLQQLTVSADQTPVSAPFARRCLLDTGTSPYNQARRSCSAHTLTGSADRMRVSAPCARRARPQRAPGTSAWRSGQVEGVGLLLYAMHAVLRCAKPCGPSLPIVVSSHACAHCHTPAPHFQPLHITPKLIAGAHTVTSAALRASRVMPAPRSRAPCAAQ